MPNSPEPPIPHHLRMLIYPNYEVDQIINKLMELRGRVAVMAVSFLVEEQERTEVATGDDIKKLRRWYSLWACSDDIDYQQTMVGGAIKRLEVAYAADGVRTLEGSGEPMKE